MLHATMRSQCISIEYDGSSSSAISAIDELLGAG